MADCENREIGRRVVGAIGFEHQLAGRADGCASSGSRRTGCRRRSAGNGRASRAAGRSRESTGAGGRCHRRQDGRSASASSSRPFVPRRPAMRDRTTRRPRRSPRRRCWPRGSGMALDPLDDLDDVEQQAAGGGVGLDELQPQTGRPARRSRRCARRSASGGPRRGGRTPGRGVRIGISPSAPVPSRATNRPKRVTLVTRPGKVAPTWAAM